MAEAYKVKSDTSFPKPIHKIGEDIDGNPLYEVVGVAYVEGSYVLESELLPRDRERAVNGDLDYLLEPASVEDVDAYRRVEEFSTFIPEHEAEAVVFQEYGHEVVPRDQVLELKSAGAEEARQALEAAKADGADERPNLKAAEVPSLARVSNDKEGKVNNVPEESEHVSEENLVGVEQPPGVNVGEVKKASEQGQEVVTTAEAAEVKKAGRPRRASAKPEKVAEQAEEKKD